MQAIPDIKPGAHIHLIGICGTAMASLAGLMQSQGFKITGSDNNVYPPMSTQLENLGIAIQNGYRAENLQPRPDLVIVGNVISKTNPEAEALLNSDIPYTSLPIAMGHFAIDRRESFVVAGTHGKTTTTSLLAWVTDAQKMGAGFMIGGIPLNYGSSFRNPTGGAFVIEGDEYDTAFFDKVPKFIHYRPRHVILTSIEYDHADIYKDLDAVLAAFGELLKLIPEEGTLIYNAEDENIDGLLSECRAKKQFSYGVNAGDYQVRDRSVLHGRNQFTVEFQGNRVADLALKIFGPHNTLNALSVFAMSHVLGWNETATLQAMADFKGVKRRQEHLGDVSGVTIIEDFAHHPTAVQLTIETMRERFPGRRLLTVFEPRSATSRRNVFQAAYAEAFSEADLIFMAQPFDQSKIKAEERFSTDQLIHTLEAAGKKAFSAENVSLLTDRIIEKARSGDVILIMSNGGFDGIYQKLLAGLK